VESDLPSSETHDAEAQRSARLNASEEIHHVSDTALWVAAYRAEESERPDAAFRDPLAKVLAGERGRKIAKAMAVQGIMRWIMVIRTVAIDRLIQMAISKGADTVVNLGAGLDTRPYRMPLPENIRWIEVDFEDMIAMKNQKLAGEKPVCRLERVSLDLTSRELRRSFFAKIASESKSVLVITEGVLPYLKPEAVAELASDLRDVSGFRFWIQDFYQGDRHAWRGVRWRKKLKSAPFQFMVKDWFEFFGAFGWEPEEIVYGVDQGRILKRRPEVPFFLMMYWKIFGTLAPKFMKRRFDEKVRKRFGYVLMRTRQ
jgi:methyltransferase (TIGR00027 family)